MNPIFDLKEFISQSITERRESLLKKDLETFHQQLDDALTGKSCLVIGGAGTIGTSYIMALLKFRIEKLIVIDINENGLTELIRNIRSSDDVIVPEIIKTYPVNFGDRVFEKIFNHEGPFDVVANFAAHKHVRSEKDSFSIEAMIDNNVFKANQLLELLKKKPPQHFFCVSTDKAANPVNIMGASKKLMEDVILSYADAIPIKTARFANVAFSNGSLLFGFLERISRKQPLSCPLGIKRFFVSPEESGQICLIASILGESGDIFFPKLDMEKDLVSFSDIALAFIKALGYEPDICSSEGEAIEKAKHLSKDSTSYPVYFFDSDTSGEKPYEEFYTDSEELDLQLFSNLGVIKKAPQLKTKDIQSIIKNLTDKFESQNLVDKSEIVLILKEYLPNFDHIEKGKGLDQRM
ncbi:polysaccharide biosynthesis protein [Chitinophaga arvensicola]|uniref:Polysaccharide biosynthesis protein n=1 Tax=Chitinophaga arvensicola TaxID=29529 RepID=A0A1I0NQE2_9BACT|nr:polysaccharide biosynthesis protein [Chitinophaga arvensicola]SEW03114.1 Polysaccharide biosynthesis protein [Chitinophaga arvensicola]